jgi:hypothetical protein
MKVINYKQLCKAPIDTLFSTINKMNELGEILVLGEYPDGRRFIYSPVADVSSMIASKEIDFDENSFNRAGSFIVWEHSEISAFCEKLKGIAESASPFAKIAASMDETVLETCGTALIPVYSVQSARYFVAADLIEPMTVELEGEVFQTSALAMNVHYSLLGISHTVGLLESGVLDSTDALDPNMGLKRIYFHLQSLGMPDEVIPVDIEDLPNTQAHCDPKGVYRKMEVTFLGDVAMVAGAQTVDGSPSGILTQGWVPRVAIYGSVHLELGDAHFLAQRVDSFNQGYQLVRCTVIGYDLKACRINQNRRLRKAA